MEDLNREKHWNHIYETKELKEVSWYQSKPETSLAFIEGLQLPKSASIIDMGGGDSFLVDHLLAAGFENITVLDISEKAIEKAKHRLGDAAQKVNWLVADAAQFQPHEKYNVWHDRAAFHFLTDEDEIDSYVKTCQQHITKGGTLILGTFSENGPKKCSGIEIKQYSKEALTAQFQNGFEKIECINLDHETPSGGIQNFTFCKFKKVEA